MDPDAWDCAADFVGVFREAGWSIVGHGIAQPSINGPGLDVLYATPEDAKGVAATMIQQAMIDAGLRIRRRGANPILRDNEVEVVIGYNDSYPIKISQR